jgi:CrcB protein
MKVLTQCLAVGGAGFLGAVARFLITQLCIAVFGPGFPTGTMLINVMGSFALGWLTAIIAQGAPISRTMQLALGVGFLGAFTTFSTRMNDTVLLGRSGRLDIALLNLLASMILGLLAVSLGIWIATR